MDDRITARRSSVPIDGDRAGILLVGTSAYWCPQLFFKLRLQLLISSSDMRPGLARANPSICPMDWKRGSGVG
jgi:hypothetical protein